MKKQYTEYETSEFDDIIDTRSSFDGSNELLNVYSVTFIEKIMRPEVFQPKNS